MPVKPIKNWVIKSKKENKFSKQPVWRHQKRLRLTLTALSLFSSSYALCLSSSSLTALVFMCWLLSWRLEAWRHTNSVAVDRKCRGTTMASLRLSSLCLNSLASRLEAALLTLSLFPLSIISSAFSAAGSLFPHRVFFQLCTTSVALAAWKEKSSLILWCLEC